MCLDDFQSNWEGMFDQSPDVAAIWKDAWKVYNKYQKNVEEISRKQTDDAPINMDDFVCTGKIDEDLAKMYADLPQVAEGKYYGFGWDHFMEYSPDYDGGMTFERFEDESKLVLCVECQVIKQPEKRTSKSGKTTYYTTLVEDANCNQQMVTIWEEDYLRFKEEFEFWDGERRGNLVKVRLERPGPGFKSYTFESWPRQMRSRYMPKEKSQDYRSGSHGEAATSNAELRASVRNGCR
jgi:hypothetical protein